MQTGPFIGQRQGMKTTRRPPDGALLLYIRRCVMFIPEHEVLSLLFYSRFVLSVFVYINRDTLIVFVIMRCIVFCILVVLV